MTDQSTASAPGASAGRVEYPLEHRVEFDGHLWVPQSPGVHALDADSTGVWAVRTQGAVYVLDMDARRFMRCPTAQSRAGAMPFDRTLQRFTRIQVLPSVGGHLHLWFDDPHAVGPALVEHFRISSAIRSIAPMTPTPHL